MDNSILGSENDKNSNTKVLLQNDSEKAHNGISIEQAQSGLWCPNCGAALVARKCKLFCQTPGCGYLVTCSEW